MYLGTDHVALFFSNISTLIFLPFLLLPVILELIVGLWLIVQFLRIIGTGTR